MDANLRKPRQGSPSQPRRAAPSYAPQAISFFCGGAVNQKGSEFESFPGGASYLGSETLSPLIAHQRRSTRHCSMALFADRNCNPQFEFGAPFSCLFEVPPVLVKLYYALCGLFEPGLCRRRRWKLRPQYRQVLIS